MTSKDYLSQEEIDALLRQSESIASSEPAQKTVDDFLTELEQDALGRLATLHLAVRQRRCPRRWALKWILLHLKYRS